jgi:hypothetical protein
MMGLLLKTVGRGPDEREMGVLTETDSRFKPRGGRTQAAVVADVLSSSRHAVQAAQKGLRYRLFRIAISPLSSARSLLAMSLSLPHSKGLCLGLGIVIGLAAGAFLPQAPLHAVATDRSENFVMSTGVVSEELEGVFFLDSLTGDLKGTIINPFVQPPTVGITYSRNVVADMKIDVAKSPKFVMVTGLMPLRPLGGLNQFADSVVYVAELSSGMMACYGMQFNFAAFNNMRGASGEFLPFFVGPFRKAVVR